MTTNKNNSSPSIIYGIDTDGNPVHVDSAKNGRKCGLVCKECHGELSAKQGKVNSHHFSHVAAQSLSQAMKCSETALHLAAKLEILKMESIFIPNGCNGKIFYEFGDVIRSKVGVVEKFPAKILEGVNEHAVVGGEMVYDCFLRVQIEPNCFHDIAVEIFVTHKVDDHKLSKIKRHRMTCLQIDMSKIKRMSNYNASDLVSHILNTDHIEVINLSPEIKKDFRRLSGVAGMTPRESKHCMTLYEHHISSKLIGKTIDVTHFGDKTHNGVNKQINKKIPMVVLGCSVVDNCSIIEIRLKGGKTLSVEIVKQHMRRWGDKVEKSPEILISSEVLVDPSLLMARFSKNITTINTGRFIIGSTTTASPSYRAKIEDDKRILLSAIDIVKLYVKESKRISNDSTQDGDYRGVFNLDYKKRHEIATPGIHRKTDEFILRSINYIEGVKTKNIRDFMILELGDYDKVVSDIKSKLADAEKIIRSSDLKWESKKRIYDLISEAIGVFDDSSMSSWARRVALTIEKSTDWRILRGDFLPASVFSTNVSSHDLLLALDVLGLCDMNPLKSWGFFYENYRQGNNEYLNKYTKFSAYEIAEKILSCIASYGGASIDTIERLVFEITELPDFHAVAKTLEDKSFENKIIGDFMRQKLIDFKSTSISSFVDSVMKVLVSERIIRLESGRYYQNEGRLSQYISSFVQTRSTLARAKTEKTADIYEDSSWGKNDILSRKLTWD